MLERASALTNIIKPGRYGNPAPEAMPILIAEMYGRRITQVTAWPDTLQAVQGAISDACGVPCPVESGRAETLDRISVVRLGPYRYWIIADRESQPELSGLDTDTAAIVDLTDSRTVLRIQGNWPREILAKGFPIDTHPDVFPVGSMAQGAIGHVGVLVHYVSAGSGDMFDIYVASGFARSFWDWLTTASLEFGYEIA